MHFVLEVLGELDLSAIEDALHSRDARGQKGYHPRMMVALLLYSYCSGVYSSRRIARATYEDLATRFLTGDQHPHFTRIAAFRREHLDALSSLFVATVQLCARAGLVELGHVSVDGTQIQANASKHKAMSYERMKKEENRLQAEIKALLERAEAVDREEDERFGVGRDDFELPGELKRRETRLARIRQAKAELEAEAKEARAAQLREHAAGNDERTEKAPTAKERAAAATRATRQRQEADKLDPPNDDDDDEPPSKLPAHRVRTQPDGTPKPKAQRNFTDPDSRIMVDGQGAYVQGYNAQAAVSEGHQVIVACALSNQAPDPQYLVPVLEEVEANTGDKPKTITADAGYWSAANSAWCEEQGIDAHIATGRRRRNSETTGQSPPSQSSRQRMADKLRSPEGDACYRRRKATVEPVFGQIKEARGFRRFLLRGLHKVRAEWALLCATHNLLKLFRRAWAAA